MKGERRGDEREMCSAQRDWDWRQRAGLLLCPLLCCSLFVLTCRHERHEETNEEVSSQLIGRRLVGGAQLDKGKSSSHIPAAAER